MDREDKKYIESGELGCSLENESLKEETKEIITIDDSNLNDYIQEYIYPMSLDEILSYLDVEYTTEVERGPSFILPNGKILSVGRNYKDWDPDEWLIHDYVLLDICDKVFEDKIGYDNLDKDYSYPDDFINVFTDNYGVIRINTGEFESENRFYCVLPDRALNKPTLNQYETLTKFFDYGLEHGQKEVSVFFGVQFAKEHTYSLIDNTSDEIIKKIMRFYGTGTLVEKEYAQPSKLYNIDKETAYWPEDAEDWLYWSSESDKWAEDYAKSYKVKMSPKDFLDLTTENGADSLTKGHNLGFGELKDLDIDEFNRERYQPIFLQAAFRDKNQPNTAQVTGHEGRHRMFALMTSGVTSVDVELKCDVYDTNYQKYKPFKLDYIDLIGQFNKSVRVRVNNPIPMSWKQHKAIRPNLKDEELNEYLDEIETSYDYPIFVTDEVYRIKSMLQRADTPYRIYNLEETYYMQDATGNKTHGDMLQYAKEQGYIAGNTRISSEDSEYVYPEDSDEGYIVFIPKDFSGHLRWHTRLGDDSYFSCKVYPFGNLYVRDSAEYNDGLFSALGEAERTLWYDELEGTVDIVDKNGDTRKFDVSVDLDDDPENASSVDLSSKEVITTESNKNKNLTESKQDIEKFRQWAGDELADRFFKLKDRLPDRTKDIYYWMGMEKQLLNLKDRYKNAQENSNISNYEQWAHENSINGLKLALDEIEKTPTRKEINKLGKEGSEKIYEDDNWLVLKINTYEASVKYGKGTEWCITGNNSDQGRDDFDFHTKDSDATMYFFLNKKNKNSKYALEYVDDKNWCLFDETDFPHVGYGTPFNNGMNAMGGECWHKGDLRDTFPVIKGLPDINKAYDDFENMDESLQLKDVTESYMSDYFELGKAGYILPDGSFVYMDEYHGEDPEYRSAGHVEFSNTHCEEDTCVRIFKKPNDIQYKKLEEVIDRYLDEEEYCKVEIGRDFYEVYSLREGACQDPYWNERIGNWTGYKLVQIIKNYFTRTEGLSREEIENKVANELGTSKEPVEGPSYILEDGSFLKIWNSNKDIKGMSGSKSVSGKTMHLDVDGFINKEIDADSYSYYYLNVDCIRVNTGFEEYIVLPKYRPNNAQFDSLLKWLNFYFFDMKHDKLKVMDWYGSYANSQEYYLDKTMPEGIIKKIKMYYSTGELRESTGKFRVEWTTPEDSFEKSFSTYQKALDYYTDIRDGDVFWSTIEMYDTSKTPAELLAIDYKSNADIDKYLNNENLQEKIVKKGSKWQVQSEKGKNLGTYDTKKEAEDRLKDVEMFKHMNEDVNSLLSKLKNNLSSYKYEFIESGWYDKNGNKIIEFEDDWEPDIEDVYYENDMHRFSNDKATFTCYINDLDKTFTIDILWAKNNSKGDATELIKKVLDVVSKSNYSVQINNNLNQGYWNHIFSKYYPNLHYEDVYESKEDKHTAQKMTENVQIDEDMHNIYYHGSSQKLNKLNSPINWITEDKEYAKYYALALNNTGYIYTCEAELDNVFDVGQTGYNAYALFPIMKPFKISSEMKKITDKLNLSEEEAYKLIDDAIAEYPQTNEYKTKISTVVRSVAFKKILESKGYTSIHTVEYNNRTSMYCDCYGILDSNDVKIVDSEEVHYDAKLNDK